MNYPLQGACGCRGLVRVKFLYSANISDIHSQSAIVRQENAFEIKHLIINVIVSFAKMTGLEIFSV